MIRSIMSDLLVDDNSPEAEFIALTNYMFDFDELVALINSEDTIMVKEEKITLAEAIALIKSGDTPIPF